MRRLITGPAVGALALALLLVACTALAAAPKAPAGQYGPCCPYVTGHASPNSAPARSYWGAERFRGPQRVCETPRSVSLVYRGTPHQVDAVEVEGTVLVPLRLLAVTGATIDYAGAGKSAVVLGDRRVELMPGHHEIRISEGGTSRHVSWTLCPRLRHGITYVPLRPAAEALGLTLDREGTQLVLGGGPLVPTALSSEKCPAQQVEEDLGLTLLRGPLSGPRGPGIGVLAVTAGGRAAALGLRPRDVILTANGQRVTCPKDLAAALTAAAGAQGGLSKLSVVRGQKKLTLTGQQ